MGQLIKVDFTARRVSLDDPVQVAKRIRRAIKKADLSPKLKVSVRTIRAQSVIEPDRIVVTVKGAEGQVYSRAWLDWAINPKTKHRPRPAALPRYTDQMAAVMRTLRTIVKLHPGPFVSDVRVDPALGIAELHKYGIRQAGLRLSTS